MYCKKCDRARYPGSLAGAMNQLDLTFEWGYTYGYVYNI